MPRSQRPLRFTRPYQLSDTVRNDKFWEERLSAAQPVIGRAASSIFALPTASAAQVNSMVTPQGKFWEYYQTTAQTLQPVPHATKGLVLDGDQVDNESAEYVPGGNSAISPFAFTIPSTTVTGSNDFFFEGTFEITDASGSDQLLLGFRKQEAFQVPTSFLNGGAAGYTDFAAIGFCATKADPNPVGTVYSQASAVNVAAATGFVWADAGIHTLGVRVVGGKPLFFINGIRIGNPITVNGVGTAITSQATVSGPSISWTAGQTVIPFIFVRQDADLTDAVYLRSYRIGSLVDAGLDPNNE